MTGSGQFQLLYPGDRLVNLAGEEASTDLLDEAVQEVSFALAAGSFNDLADTLGGLTEPGLQDKVAASVADLLASLPAGDLQHLADVVARWPVRKVDASLLSRLADAMLPQVEGMRGDRLRFAGDRLRDAMALLRVGKEMLREVAALLPSPEFEASNAVRDPGSFTPGAWVRLGEHSVPTDPLELLGREVGTIVAEVSKLDHLDRLLVELTASLDERGRPVGTLRAHLTEETGAELAAALGLSAMPSIPEPPTSLEQLRRVLEHAPGRHATVEDAWQALASKDASFAPRWAAGVHLLRQTRELVRDDPAQAAAWAARVQTVADDLASFGELEERMAHCLSRLAHAHVGNALRVQGHLLVAERFFLPWEEDDPLGLRAEYLGLKAALLQAQRQFREALHLLGEADRIASRRDLAVSFDTAARIRVSQARICILLGDYDTASAFLQTTLGVRVSLLPEQTVIPRDKLSPHVCWIALQNLADALSKAGRLEQAKSVLKEIDELGAALSLPKADFLRTQWVRARLEVRTSWRAGADMLKAVRQRFLDLRLLYDAALASLELAEWHAEVIRGTETDAEHLAAIRELATGSTPTTTASPPASTSTTIAGARARPSTLPASKIALMPGEPAMNRAARGRPRASPADRPREPGESQNAFLSPGLHRTQLAWSRTDHLAGFVDVAA